MTGGHGVARIIGGRGVRVSLLIGSLAAGLVIAMLTYHRADLWLTPGFVFDH